MNKVKFFFFLFSFFFFSCSKKVLQIPVTKSEDTNGRYIDSPLLNDSLTKDTSLLLSNKITVEKYVFDFKNIFDCCPNLPIKKMGILLAVKDSNTIYIVVDRNFDKNFTNDSVVTVILPDSVIDKEKFKKLFPILQVVVNEEPSLFIKKNTVSFQVYPGFYEPTIFKQKLNLNKLKQMNFQFVNEFALQGVAKLNRSFSFQIRFSNCFFLQNQDSILSARQFVPFTFIVTKKVKQFDSLVQLSIHTEKYGNSYLNNDSIILLRNRKYYLDQFSYREKKITLRRVSSKGLQKNELKSSVVLTNTSTGINEAISFYDLAKQQKTILFFTGSWCAPCRTALTDLKKFYDSAKNEYNIIVIQKESSIIYAKKYVKENNIQWQCFFEKLLCTEPNCTENLFHVKSYPTIVFINNNGIVVSKFEGSDSVEKLVKNF